MKWILWGISSVTNPYVRFVRRDTAYIWDTEAEALDNDPDWANTDVALAQDDNHKGWTVSVPADLPDGSYYVPLYSRAGATAANTDTCEEAWIIEVMGGKIELGRYPVRA